MLYVLLFRRSSIVPFHGSTGSLSFREEFGPEVFHDLYFLFCLFDLR